MLSIIKSDSPALWQFGFQNPATPVMEGIVALHNYVFIYLILVFIVVGWFLIKSIYMFNESKNKVPTQFSHDPVIETVWTVAPAFALLAIAMPSFSLLYSMDDVIEPDLTVKIVGHQWYWSYELDVRRVDYLYDYVKIDLPKPAKYSKIPAMAKLHKKLLKEPYLKMFNNSKLKILKHALGVKPRQHLFDLAEEIKWAKNLTTFIKKTYHLDSSLKFYKAKFSQPRFFEIFSKFFKIEAKKNITFFELFEFITRESIIRHSISFVSPPLKFDSYMVPEASLPQGGLRLLEVDNRLALPIETNIRLLVTSADVIHSWAVPALGVKVDAVPGRLNQTGLFIKREGVFYGQCSELCGVNHGFMPIVVEAVDYETFILWAGLKTQPVKFDDMFGTPGWEIRIEE